ncbi:DUF4493 domain-containing protein [Ekhidna sp. MALMAid0563]|uniref:DUF4493 domain-containing protein n=1 Tax=Ekhidna sp. MALMAid0563 TaxID=3143937 RepID=UPI0032DF319D
MKNIAIVLIVLFIITSCGDRNDLPEPVETGFLSLGVSLNIESESANGRTSTGDPDEFYVAVHDINDAVVISYPRLADAPPVIELPTGEYYVVAHSDNLEEAAFDNPYYYGRSENFTIDKEEEKIVDILAVLANCKVSFHYSENVTNTFDLYTGLVTVRSSGTTLSYDQGETREGYFALEPLDIQVNLSYTKLDGTTIDRTFTATIEDPKPKTLYKVNVDASLQDGQIVFNLIVDETFEEEDVHLGEMDSDLPLIGTIWTILTYEVRDCDDPIYNGFFECEANCEIMIFNADGSFVSTDPDFTFEQFTYSYTVEGDVLTIITSDDSNDYLNVYTYEIVGNELILADPAPDSFTGCFSVEIFVGT